jgi:hypothetical protein
MVVYDRGAIRLALATRLTTVTGIKHVYPYVVEAIDSTPAAYVSGFAPIEFHRTYGRGRVTSTFRVIVVFGRVDSPDSQAAMDLLLSNLPLAPDPAPVTLLDALEGDPTLGGVCSTVVVKRADEARAVTIAANDYLALDVDVEIRT